MQSKTFLELVNSALLETKVTLDPLTSANFASPPRTLLYNNFKNWVNKAYRDLMLSHPEWFFRVERGVTQLYPRLHLSGLTYIPSIGDVLEGSESGVRFEVLAVHSFEDNELDPAIERTVDVAYLNSTSPADMIPLEQLNMITPTPLLSVGYVKGAGRYTFDEVVGLDEIDPDTVVVFFEDSSVGHKLQWVDYSKWARSWSTYPYSHAAHPDSITRAPDGAYEFYPQPTEPFTIEFNFTRQYDDMVQWDDLPIGVDAKYQELLVWMAVAEYADFDNNAKVYARASKNIVKYEYFLRRDALPRISIGRSKFYTYGW